MVQAVSWRRVCVVFTAGVVLLGIGGGMIPLVDIVVRNKIKETVIISNSSELWDVFSDPPIPIYMQFWMFNLSNPQEVKTGAKPVVVEHGPYTYRERRKKFNIVFNDNGTVTYRQKRTFFFMRNMSVGSDNDLFITANPPVLAVVNSLQYAPTLLREAINAALELYKEDIFMTRPVRELLWGYTDPALKLLKAIYPAWFYTDFVGFFINKNDTDDGLYTVVTGSQQISHLGQITRYNGSSYLPYWTTSWANMVNGSDGTLSPPFEQDTQTLPMFSSDVCRSVYGKYQKTVTTRRDISLRRFVGTSEELANATINPDNIGFCTPNTTCLPSGLLNISNCQIVDYFHIPVVISFPHFYMADPAVIDSVGGMHPVPEEHQTAVDVEPWTGLVLQAFKRLQINMFITKVDNVKITGDVRSMYLPVFWLNESAVVDEEHADLLHSQLFVPLMVTGVLWKVLLGVGAFLVLMSVLVSVRNCSATSHTPPPSHEVYSSDPPTALRSNDRVRDRRPQGKHWTWQEREGEGGRGEGDHEGGEEERRPLLGGGGGDWYINASDPPSALTHSTSSLSTTPTNPDIQRHPATSLTSSGIHQQSI